MLLIYLNIISSSFITDVCVWGGGIFMLRATFSLHPIHESIVSNRKSVTVSRVVVRNGPKTVYGELYIG